MAVRSSPMPMRRAMIAGGLALMADATLSGLACAKGAKVQPAGVQLWTVDAALRADPPGTLKAVKAAGYDAVEAAGTAGTSAAAFRSMIDDAGLTCRSAHVAMADLVGDLASSIDMALALGATWLVCASPQPLKPLPPGDWLAGMVAVMDLDAWTWNAERIAHVAPDVKRAGLRLAWHNHVMEFRPLIDGSTGLDRLLAVTAAQDLRLELDLGWCLAAGLDPVAAMTQYAERLELLHIKDMVRDATMPLGWRSTEIGQGRIDWRSVFVAARQLDVRAWFVEQEAPFRKPPLESLRESRAFLAGIGH